MKKYFLFFILIYNTSYGQKPVITLDSFKSWSEVRNGGLSKNGNFAFYEITNFPTEQNTVVIKLTSGKQLLSLINLTTPKFSEDSRYFLGILPNDTLFIYDLKNHIEKKMSDIVNYDVQMIGNRERLICKKKDYSIVLCDFVGQPILNYANVKQYKFSPLGSKLIVEQFDVMPSKKVTCRWINTVTGNDRIIYVGKNVNSIVFDRTGRQAAFMVNDNETFNSIYYYADGNATARQLLNDEKFKISQNLSIDEGQYFAFSKDENRIFFAFKVMSIPTSTSPVEIWSYQDRYLKSYFDKNNKPQQYLSTVSIETSAVTQLLKGNEQIVPGTLRYETDSVFVVASSYGLSTEEWNPSSKVSYYICNSKFGQFVPIDVNDDKAIFDWNLSPNGKYLVYYDRVIKQYFCYNIATRVTRNISEHIEVKFSRYTLEDHHPEPESVPIGIAGWLKDDRLLLVNTTFDIWMLDPEGANAPVNATEGIGVKNKTVFYLVMEQQSGTIDKNENIILSAFDTQNKNYGFYSLSIGKGTQLKRLSMDQCYNQSLIDVYASLLPHELIKSDHSNGYLMLRQTATEAPNYFYSRDLREFKSISDIQPQRKYNWLTSELHSYTDSLGREYQGVLYKPENFKPEYKYPVIFNIYEIKSNLLNEFYNADLMGADFNIPTLVSNGYLVFLPDIKGMIDAPGEGAMRSIVAATNHLDKFAWVDKKKYAIVGHSFGGFETNYIITHSNRFAAAISGAGTSNMIDAVLSLNFSGGNKQYFIQNSGYMMRSTVNNNLDAYIKNSPIFKAKHLTTPTLFMHNDNDGSVDYHHTQTFFVALRSLQKPVWWLKYKGMGHGVGEQNFLDFNTKVWQFLDHYLKDKPLPEWMRKHI